MVDSKSVRTMYIGAWVVGIIVVVLIFWGFFGKSHHKPVVEPVMTPATASTAN